MKKKSIALLMAVVMLFGVTVGATIAWLTSTTGTVTNTFTVGNIEITLDESLVDNYGEKYLISNADDTNRNGVIESTEIAAKGEDYVETPADPNTMANATRVMENDYKLIPGHTYIKDPTVHVSADSEDCFVFVKVVDDIANIEAAKTIETQMLEKGWEKVSGEENVWYWTADADATTITTKPVAVEAGTNIAVFDTFTLTDGADVAAYENKTIVINAYAIQVDGLTDATPEDIWANF
ncbi:MAG: hypothetical protein IJ410_01505 [Oscillospiraceae bacterium]|nr:hypothetical protein [Oscillospiraceae bacterium]